MAVMVIYKRHYQFVSAVFASAAMLTVCSLDARKLSMEKQVDAYGCLAASLSVSVNMTGTCRLYILCNKV